MNKDVGRVDVDYWLELSCWEDILKDVRKEKARVCLGIVEDGGGEGILGLCESFVTSLIRIMMVVIRSLKIENQYLKSLDRRETGGEGDGKPKYVGYTVSTMYWYVKV
jgi:hypothetical protein